MKMSKIGHAEWDGRSQLGKCETPKSRGGKKETHTSAVSSMVYHCFLDDSKDKHQKKLMVSAGFFGRKEDWDGLRLAWKSVLKSHGIDYFKSSEYYRLDGQFERFEHTTAGLEKGIYGVVAQVMKRPWTVRNFLSLYFLTLKVKLLGLLKMD